MASRRVAHSRNGCVMCKQRKVRCGEQHPACTACVRLHLNCQYVDGKSDPLQPQQLYPHRRQQGPGRSRYIVRFVNSNKIVEPSRDGDVKPTSLRARSKDQKNNCVSAGPHSSFQTPSESDAISMAVSKTVGDMLDHRDGQLSTASLPIGSSIEESSDLVSEAQLREQLSIADSVLTPSVESNLQSFFSDFDSEVISDMSLQLFDTLDQDLWLNQVESLSGTAYENSFAVSEESHLNQDYVQDLIPSSYQITSDREVPPFSNENEETSVKISTSDHSLIHHFLTAMKKYSTKLLKTSEEDVNCVMFSNLGLFNAQLFHSMMAFAALHRAQTQDSFFAQAELRYQRATALLYEDEQPYKHLDVTISTVWFLLQYELLFANGVVRFCNLLTHLAAVLDEYPIRGSARPDHFTKLGARTLVSMATYDVRALISGGHAGYLLQSIEAFLPLRVLLEEPSYSFDSGPLPPLSDSIPATLPIDHTAILRLRLRCNIMHGRIIMLSTPERFSGNSDNGSISDESDAEWAAIRNSMLEQHDILDRNIDSAHGLSVKIATGKLTHLSGKLSSLRYMHLLCLSSLYAGFIDYHHAMKACQRSELSTQTANFHSTSVGESPYAPPHATILGTGECSARMVRIAWFVNQNRRLSPQSVWPSLLVVAGTESVDGIHRTWVLNSLRETETWSTHFFQTRVLLEDIYKHQAQSQTEEAVDVVKIQAQTTGPFVI